MSALLLIFLFFCRCIMKVDVSEAAALDEGF